MRISFNLLNFGTERFSPSYIPPNPPTLSVISEFDHRILIYKVYAVQTLSKSVLTLFGINICLFHCPVQFSSDIKTQNFNPLNAELNPICHLIVLLGDLTFMGPCIVSVFQYICISNKMQHYTIYLYLETALHVSSGTSTHYQKLIQLYLQHLVFVTPLLLSAAIVEDLELVWVCCGWRTPSCWIYIRILLGAHTILRISRIRVNAKTSILCILCQQFQNIHTWEAERFRTIFYHIWNYT
jgi:hypothetical protein